MPIEDDGGVVGHDSLDSQLEVGGAATVPRRTRVPAAKSPIGEADQDAGSVLPSAAGTCFLAPCPNPSAQLVRRAGFP